MVYLIAAPSEYIVVTGLGIDDIKLAKKGWIYPGQKSWKFDISPMNYSFEVNAMSIEKLPFTLPALFTIGPRDEPESLKRYAKLIALHDLSGNHVTDVIKGIVEGETRVLVAGMSMEQVFKGADHFKREVFDKVQSELDQFGLHIYNANIKQLVDIEGQEYFSYLGMKTRQEAANRAKVDVAEAKYKGDSGAKEREGLTFRNAARVDAETKIFTKVQTAAALQQEYKIEAETRIFQTETEREVAVANAQLATKKARWLQQSNIAEIESSKTAAIRDAELERDLEEKKALAATEKMRAKALSKATVDYEVILQRTNADVYAKQRDADVALYNRQIHAESTLKEADASLYLRQKNADGTLYAAQKDAEGIRLMAEAQAAYVQSMLVSFSGNTHAFHDFMMLDRRVYQDMGQINADAMKGLEPSVSIWTMESNGAVGGSGSYDDSLPSMFMTLPPLLETTPQHMRSFQSDSREDNSSAYSVQI